MEVEKKYDERYPEKRSAFAEIKMKDGRKISGFVDIAKGEPEYPLTNQEIEEKYYYYSREILGKKAEELFEKVRKLEKIKNSRNIIKSMVAVK